MQLSRTLQSAKMKLFNWGLDANFVGYNCPLRGVLFVSQKNILSRTLEAIVLSHSFAKNHSSPAAYLLLNFSYLINTSQAKSVYLGSGGGKNATTTA